MWDELNKLHSALVANAADISGRCCYCILEFLHFVEIAEIFGESNGGSSQTRLGVGGVVDYDSADEGNDAKTLLQLPNAFGAFLGSSTSPFCFRTISERILIVKVS